MTSNSGAGLVKKTHPIRGLLWGIMLGLGLAVVFVVTGVIPLELSQMAIVTVVGIGLGVVWGIFGPAKQPKGSPPAPRAAPAEAPPEPPVQPDDATADADEPSGESEGSGTPGGSLEASPDDPDAAGSGS